MFPKCFYFVILIVVCLQLKGVACFFVSITQRTDRYREGICITDTGQIQSNGSWGNLSFLELSDSCLDPTAQFRFRDNGAMLNIKRQGCLAAFHRNGSGYDLDMFYLYVDSVSLDTAACAQKPNQSIYRAITQTSEGALSVYYKGKNKSSFETWCAESKYDWQLYNSYRIYTHIGLTPRCDSIDQYRQGFLFGSATCFGDKVKNVNCPKDQYMVVKIATFRGLLAPRTCGVNDNYNCEVDVTCVVKKQCDGLHECSIIVDNNLFPGDLCPGLSNYLYFKYQCVDTVKPYKEPCVHDVSLNSSVPYKGVLQITTDNGTKNVCWESLNYNVRKIVCRHLGYYQSGHSAKKISTPTNAKDATFSGSINCTGEENYLSQCAITASASESCSELSYIECVPSLYYSRPVLADEQRFPDSSFSASASSQGHSASDARASSGSSWCAPVSNETHYLQVDFGRLYELLYVVTYGDSNSPKWLITYIVYYTVDFMNWKTLFKIRPANTNAYDRAAVLSTYTEARVLRFVPLTYVGQPCMRVEIWGRSITPDKPGNLTVTNITPTSAKISWLYPKDQGYGISRFSIKLKKDNSQILSITTGNVNGYEINNLTPYTKYEISVAAGNYRGFGEETTTSFSTSEDIDECKNSSLHNCSREEYRCVNTLGSYKCVCREGTLENGECKKDLISYRLNLRLNENYRNELSNIASKEFKTMNSTIINAMGKVHKNNAAYRGVKIEQLTNGSIIAALVLTFTTDNTKGITELLAAVRNNSFGNFSVDPDALTIVLTGVCPSDECPGNSTCKQLTSDTISCPCKEDYYYDGVKCIEYLKIKVQVSLVKEFTEDLKNTSSPAYIELKRDITAELNEQFKNTANFKEVRVLGFRNGSVIVEFVVIYRKDRQDKRIVVSETVKEEILKTNKLGKYDVKSIIIREPPPKPEELKHGEVTENRIEISWKKPIGHGTYGIKGYKIHHRTIAETTSKTENVTVETETNLVLSKLQSDTFYVITVHAFNTDGDGDEIEMQVSTKPDDSSDVVIIIVVVIVVVLLLIVFLVVFYKLRQRRHRQQARQTAYARSKGPGVNTMTLSNIPSKSTHYDNYGHKDEEASSSQRL